MNTFALVSKSNTLNEGAGKQGFWVKKKKDIIILCRLTNQEKFPLKKREKEKNNRRKIVPMKI